MTRREFDQATKENWGGRMASDERASYRERRLLEHGSGPAFGDWKPYGPDDYLARRAAKMRRLRAWRYPWDKPLPTLGIGSPFWAPQKMRATAGLPL